MLLLKSDGAKSGVMYSSRSSPRSVMQGCEANYCEVEIKPSAVSQRRAAGSDDD